MQGLPIHFIKTLESRLQTSLVDFKFLSGGCINYSGKLETKAGPFFIKWNDKNRFPQMFEKEAASLKILAETCTAKIPQVVVCGEEKEDAFLVLEYIPAEHPSDITWSLLGSQLADLHRKTGSTFGLPFDNYIGSLPQSNKKTTDWITFFREERLKKQMEVGEGKPWMSSALRRKMELLYAKLPDLLQANIKPSLLHGDLWSGNVIMTANAPWLVDPAAYYGNYEAELAFTRLFGGFSSSFYTSYTAATPLEKGFEERKDLYNLYPLLVHANLFGGGYANNVLAVLDRFV